MSQRISEKIKNQEPSEKQYNLSAFEFAFINELLVLLQFHTKQEQIMNNFLTYVAVERLGYRKIKPGHILKFDLDTIGDEENPQPVIRISEVPAPQNS